MNVVRIRGERELLAFEGLLLGDDPVRLVLHDGSRDVGMVLGTSNGTFKLLRMDGSICELRYEHVLDAEPLDPGPAFDAVVDALDAGGFIRTAEVIPLDTKR